MGSFEVEVSTFDKSPSAAVVYEAISEMLNEGRFPYRSHVNVVRPKDTVIALLSPEGDAVGVTVFYVDDPVCKIVLTYVEPSSRGLGGMRRMLEELHRQVPDMAVQAFVCHEDNELRSAAEKLGFRRSKGNVMVLEGAGG